MKLHARSARFFARKYARGWCAYGIINGLPGFVVEPGGAAPDDGAGDRGGRITGIYVMRNPDKLGHLGS